LDQELVQSWFASIPSLLPVPGKMKIEIFVEMQIEILGGQSAGLFFKLAV